jgi:hypothetical protein
MSEMFIYCDDASHARRTAVVTFVRGPEGRWMQVPKRWGKAARGHQSRGLMLEAPDSSLRFPANSPEAAILARVMTFGPNDNPRARFVFPLFCRKCKARRVEVRSENLFPVLDALAAHGVSEVPLRVVAASLAKRSQSD